MALLATILLTSLAIVPTDSTEEDSSAQMMAEQENSDLPGHIHISYCGS